MRIFGQKYSQQIYSTYPFALRRSYTLCEEKRRCSLSLCRLLWPQQANEERPLSNPTYFRSPRRSEKCTHIHQNQPSSRISPSPNRRRRGMENSVLNSVWIVRMASYALWTLQWSCSISTIYERHLCRYARCLCCCL